MRFSEPSIIPRNVDPINPVTKTPEHVTSLRDSAAITEMLELNTCGSCSKPEKDDGSPLSRCGNCKTQLYCSVECQKKHWKTHKPTCKTLRKKNVDSTGATEVVNGFPKSSSDETVYQGPEVLIEPVKMAQAEGGYAYVIRPATNRDTVNEAFQYQSSELAISQAVGFPLRLVGTSRGEFHAPNGYAKVLGLDPDPDFPHFGESRWVPEPTGTALVMSRNLKDLHINQVTALVHFCHDLEKDAAEMATKAKRGENVDKHRFAAERINPKAFAQFFEAMKEREKAKDQKQ